MRTLKSIKLLLVFGIMVGFFAMPLSARPAGRRASGSGSVDRSTPGRITTIKPTQSQMAKEYQRSLIGKRPTRAKDSIHPRADSPALTRDRAAEPKVGLTRRSPGRITTIKPTQSQRAKAYQRELIGKRPTRAKDSIHPRYESTTSVLRRTRAASPRTSHRRDHGHRYSHRRRYSTRYYYYRPYGYYGYYDDPWAYYDYGRSYATADDNKAEKKEEQYTISPERYEQLVEQQRLEEAATTKWLLSNIAHAFATKDYSKAVFRASQAIKTQPGNVALGFAYSQSLFAVEEYARAERILRTALDGVAQTQQKIFYPIGFYADRNELNSQIEKLSAAIESSRSGMKFQLLLAYQLFGSEQYEQAQAALALAQTDYKNKQAVEVLTKALRQIAKDKYPEP
jgi:hypothetical protein